MLRYPGKCSRNAPVIAMCNNAFERAVNISRFPAALLAAQLDR